ncbi:MAG: phosphodiester glycosidase family protein, partial [Candidatus Sumerlaeota bacterium]|nr:phosphodiester glycosidase family protein [Candidatus Sumerlaeota bacterium]
HRVVYRPKWPAALINSFQLDLTNPDLALAAGKGGGSALARERIAGIAERVARQSGLRVLAGVNGGFWNAANRPVGILAGGGRVYAASNHQWTFLLGADRKAFLGAVKLSRTVHGGDDSVTLNGLNSAAPASGAHLYTAEFGEATPPLENCRLAVRLEFAEGGRMRINEPARATVKEVREGPGPLELRAGQGWLAFCANGSPAPIPERLRQPDAEVVVALTTQALDGPVDAAVSAGPMLLAEGRGALDAESAEFRRLAGADLLARTGLGLSADGKKLILMAIDGSWFGVSRGATLQDLADELLRQGAYTALNLDGGSSTAAWVADGVASRPAGLLGARPISDALFLCSRKPPAERK